MNKRSIVLLVVSVFIVRCFEQQLYAMNPSSSQEPTKKGEEKSALTKRPLATGVRKRTGAVRNRKQKSYRRKRLSSRPYAVTGTRRSRMSVAKSGAKGGTRKGEPTTTGDLFKEGQLLTQFQMETLQEELKYAQRRVLMADEWVARVRNKRDIWMQSGGKEKDFLSLIKGYEEKAREEHVKADRLKEQLEAAQRASPGQQLTQKGEKKSELSGSTSPGKRIARTVSGCVALEDKIPQAEVNEAVDYLHEMLEKMRKQRLAERAACADIEEKERAEDVRARADEAQRKARIIRERYDALIALLQEEAGAVYKEAEELEAYAARV